MFRLLALVVFAIASIADSFSSYESLDGLSELELDAFISQVPLQKQFGEPVPGPLPFNGTKLVNDPAHPFKPPRPSDERGPCPGLNTLANHGVRQEYFFCRSC